MSSKPSNVEEEIRERRKKIDALDDALLRLLNQRAAIAYQVLRLKRDAGIAIFDPQRESDVLSRLSAENRGPLDASAITTIFRCIVTEVRKAEEAENKRLVRSRAGSARSK